MNVGRGHTSAGSVYFRDSFFALDHQHGRLRLAAGLQNDGALSGESLCSVRDVKQTAFIDIETGPRTELSGSYAFVIGVGRFEPFYFHLRQLFHRDDSSLEGLLTALKELLDDVRAVITFNGTGFDLPYLASAFNGAGLANPFDHLQHRDLLQDARRVYGTDLKSRRLREIEKTLLGVERPRRPFVEGDGAHPIFEHNAMDVLSMVVLLAHLNRQGQRRSKSDPRYLVALGRLASERGDFDSAARSFRTAWELDAHGLVGADAIMRLTRLLNTSGRWDESASVWNHELRVSERLERQIRAHAELARLHERRFKDPKRALLLAEQALCLIAQSGSLRMYEKSFAELTKRVDRLRARPGLHNVAACVCNGSY